MRTIVHEMRNQLAVAMANVEAFIDGKLDPTEKRLVSVLQSLVAIDALIDDIPRDLALPVHMATIRERIDICRLIQISVESMEAAMAEKRISLEHRSCDHVARECASFMGDAVRISQILRNILLNAVAYTPEGGKVFIGCHRASGGLEIVIENSGSDLSDDDLAHVFEPGYRGSASIGVKGSGLGLAIVQRLLHDQGGSIVAERHPRGTAFVVRLNDHDVLCNTCSGCNARV